MGLCIQYTAEDISLACIDAMLMLLDVPTRPDGAPWWAGSEWDTGEARTTLVSSIREEIIKCYVLPGRPEASAAASAATRNKTEALTNGDMGGADTAAPSAAGAEAGGSGGGSVLGKRPRPEEHEVTADTADAPPAKAARSSAAPSPDDLTVYPRPAVEDASAAAVSQGAVETGSAAPAMGDGSHATAHEAVHEAVVGMVNGSHAAEDDRESGELEAGEIPQ